jgi:Fe-S cluster biogenesis protein NfuA
MKPITVYAELTPNPNSIKFVADVMLLQGGTVEYQAKADAINCPLASQLFDFTGVKSVFITSNFITISKQNDIDWFDVTNILREFIRGFLMSGEDLFIGSPFDENHIPNKQSTTTTTSHIKPADFKKEEVFEDVPFDPEAEKKIIDLLDEFVRPAVEGDGGAIHFRSFENGVVNVVLKGACSGCPSSTVTLKGGIENLLKKMVPGVREVVAVSE